jgi:ketosteroid isomerase-like protein
MTKKRTRRPSKPKLDPGLLRAHKAYEAAINSNDTDRVMAMYDKDAMILQPDGPVVSGRRQVRKWVADYFKEFKTHWKKVPSQNWVAGDYGFDQGHDTAVDYPRAGGEPTRYDSKGILIYKRQKNGEWLVYRDIWNNNKKPTSGS